MKRIMVILFGLLPASFALAQNGVNNCTVNSLTPSSGEICDSGTASFSASVTSGGTAEWSVSDTTAGDVDPKSGPSTVFTAKPGFGGQVTVTVKCGQNSSKNATVKVVAVQSLIADEGSAPGGLTNIVDWAESGEVTITATPNPDIPPDQLPSCWQMTGGTEVNRTVHTADKSVPGFTTIIASAGSSAKTQVVAVVKCRFKALARRGSSCLNIFSRDFGHGWWRLDLEPDGAKVLLGGSASGPQAYVNRYLGWACQDCEANSSCTGTGYMMKDAQNGTANHCHAWTIAYDRLKAGAYFSMIQDAQTNYRCAPPGADNCVTETRQAGSSANATIPDYWCPNDLDDWLAILVQCQ